jgi:hypothetical protein
MMDVLIVNFNVKKYVLIAKKEYVRNVIKVGILMNLTNVILYVEMDILYKNMNNVMMEIKNNLMDVMNVNINAKKSVYYVNKVYVMNVIQLDG